MNKRSNIWTIVRKEFARFFGDRTLLFTAVIMPGLLIYIVYSLMGENIGKSHVDETRPTTVYVDNLPESLVTDFDSIPFPLVTEGFNAVALIGDSLADKESSLIYVNFPPYFDSLISAHDPMSGEAAPNVRIYHNSSSDNSELAYQTVKGYLEEWENSRNNMFDINAEDPEMEETFDFGSGPVTYHFDHSECSPVNGEAKARSVPCHQGMTQDRPLSSQECPLSSRGDTGPSPVIFCDYVLK